MGARADGKHRHCIVLLMADPCRASAPIEPLTLRLVAEAALHELTAGIAQRLGTLGPGTPHRGSLQGKHSVSWLPGML